MAERFDIAIVGAGPAGMAAAWSAARCGKSVCIIDDNPAPGGQIWRGGHRAAPSAEARLWIERFAHASCEHWFATTVIAAPAPGMLLCDRAGAPAELAYDKLILATGARERFLPFPGWTSPRIAGAGGLQALVKSGLPVVGKRIIVAGSGPLLLPVAATLREHGATVAGIFEQSPWERLAGFGLALLGSWTKLQQALELKWRLRGVPFIAGAWPTRARDTGYRLELELMTSRGPITETCDLLACGFFLVPQLELPRLFGCAVADGRTITGVIQETSIEHIYAAGELTGIGGLEKSLVEGEIAGLAAAGDITAASALAPARERTRRFASRLQHAFELRPELKHLADEATIVCRCEDVTRGQLQRFDSFRSAKLQTRCGMGPCQGRICGTAGEFLLGWTDASVRPPALVTSVAALASPPAA